MIHLRRRQAAPGQAAAGPGQWLLKAVRLFLTGTMWFSPSTKQGVKKWEGKNKTKLRNSVCSLVFGHNGTNRNKLIESLQLGR
jgi:hypothetical protein